MRVLRWYLMRLTYRGQIGWLDRIPILWICLAIFIIVLLVIYLS